MDTAIKKAQEKIMYVAQDRDMLHAYRMREMAISDYNNGISAAEERVATNPTEKSIATAAPNPAPALTPSISGLTIGLRNNP
jgi:hypothetical protein